MNWEFEEKGFDLLRNKSNEYKNISKIITKKILPNILIKKDFLDIGGGNPDTLTNHISLFFNKTFVIEPNLNYRAQLLKKGYILIGETLQETILPTNSFDFILCAHVLYYIPIQKWNTEIKKILNSIKDTGLAIFILHSNKSETFSIMQKISLTKLEISAEKLLSYLKEYSNIKVNTFPYKGEITLSDDQEYQILIDFLKDSIPESKNINDKNFKEIKSCFKNKIDNSGKILIVYKNKKNL